VNTYIDDIKKLRNKKLRAIRANVKEKYTITGLVILDTWCSLHLKLCVDKAARQKIQT